MEFNSILIGSEDPAKLVEYYTKVLGKPGFSDGGYTGWQFGSGFITVGPHTEVKGKNVAPEGSSSRSRIASRCHPAHGSRRSPTRTATTSSS